MLLALDINSFALIDKLYIEFDLGLNIITGETGAGKSIVVDSINFILGSKFSKDIIKKGCERAEIKAVFDLTKKQIDHAIGLGFVLEDTTVSISRTINTASKTTCRFNEKIITLTALRELAAAFMEVHGQHENQALFNEASHIDFLDSYAFRNESEGKHDFENKFLEFKNFRRSIINQKMDGRQISARMEEIKEQIKEFAPLKWKAGEESNLKAQVEEMENMEAVTSALNESFGALYQADESGLAQLRTAMAALEPIKNINDKYQELYDRVSSIYYDLEDTVDGLRTSMSGFDFSKDRLQSMQRRLFEFSRLKKKYASDEDQMLKYMSGLKEEYSTLEYNLSHAKELKAQLKELYVKAIDAGKTLSLNRQEKAKYMEQEIISHLNDLGMKNARFKVDFQEKDLSEKGIDKVEFLFCANSGQDLKPLTKVASGGEISRLMLALKNVDLDSSPVSAMVFDEIDTGISGKMAQAVAVKLANISKFTQVICVTHQPQVCAMGDVNIIVQKSDAYGTTAISASRLDEPGKINEIARLISGKDITDSGIAHAVELIDESNNYKIK